jgi:hypothetical protein
MKEMNITGIVGTCDSYLDLVPNYIKLFTKYSSLNPFLIIGETQTLESIEVFTPGKKPWGERLLNGLEHINTKYILFTLEDYYLQTPIDSYIKHSIDIMENNDLDKISFISNSHFRNYKLNPNCELVFNFARRGKTLSQGWEEFLNSENLTYKP